MKRILYVSAMVAVILGTWLIVSFVYMVKDWPRRHGEGTLSQVKYDLFNSWNSYEGGSLEADLENAQYLWKYYGPGVIVTDNNPYYPHYYKIHELMEANLRMRSKQRVLMDALAETGLDMAEIMASLDNVDDQFNDMRRELSISE